MQTDRHVNEDVAALSPARTGLCATALPRLLADDRTRTITLALADRACRPSELEQLDGIVRSTLFVRLGELTELGIVATRRISEFPLRVEYRLNEVARTLLANELLIERQERLKLARTGPGPDAGLDNLLRLIAPVSHPATDRPGRCVLVEREPSGGTHTVGLNVRDRRVAVSEPETRSADPDVHFSGGSETWEHALVAGDTAGLSVDGDLELGQALIGAFAAALNA